MEFTIEFYVSRSGAVPVQAFLDELKRSDPIDHAAVLRGLAKLRDRQYHREPLSKALDNGLFELRHVGDHDPTSPALRGWCESFRRSAQW